MQRGNHQQFGADRFIRVAAKFWSGLVKNYYAARMGNYYYKSIKSGKPFEMNKWEENWIVNRTNQRMKL